MPADEDNDELFLSSLSCGETYEFGSIEKDAGNGHYGNDGGGSGSNVDAGGDGGTKQAPSQILVSARVGPDLQFEGRIAILPIEPHNKSSEPKKYAPRCPILTPVPCNETSPPNKYASMNRIVTRSQLTKG